MDSLIGSGSERRYTFSWYMDITFNRTELEQFIWTKLEHLTRTHLFNLIFLLTGTEFLHLKLLRRRNCIPANVESILTNGRIQTQSQNPHFIVSSSTWCHTLLCYCKSPSVALCERGTLLSQGLKYSQPTVDPVKIIENITANLSSRYKFSVIHLSSEQGLLAWA